MVVTLKTKNLTVEAIRYRRGKSTVRRFAGSRVGTGPAVDHFVVSGSLTSQLLTPGDWLIREKSGDLWVCPDPIKRRIFGD